MRRIATFITAVSLVFLGLFGAAAAQAHDEVDATFPESGSTVEAGIIDLSLTFNEEVLITNDSSGFEIVVKNAAGEKQPVGCISPLGATLSARAAIGTAGDYTVSWRSVSNDGHPAEGAYQFSVSGSAEVAPDEINNCPRVINALPDDPSAIAYSTDAIANDNTPAELGVLAIVILIVITSAVWVTAKRRKPKN